MHRGVLFRGSLILVSLLISFTVSAMPIQIDPAGEKVIIVDPVTHEWGAYSSDGTLVHSGLASAGADYCPDMGSACHTEIGSFRIRSLGNRSCKSPSFPIPNGGAPMPYCMYFNDLQALHGSYELGEANLSHGCVRMRVSDAQWLRYNFAEIGTLVIIKPY